MVLAISTDSFKRGAKIIFEPLLTTFELSNTLLAGSLAKIGSIKNPNHHVKLSLHKYLINTTIPSKLEAFKIRVQILIISLKFIGVPDILTLRISQKIFDQQTF